MSRLKRELWGKKELSVNEWVFCLWKELYHYVHLPISPVVR